MGKAERQRKKKIISFKMYTLKNAGIRPKALESKIKAKERGGVKDGSSKFPKKYKTQNPRHCSQQVGIHLVRTALQWMLEEIRDQNKFVFSGNPQDWLRFPGQLVTELYDNIQKKNAEFIPSARHQKYSGHGIFCMNICYLSEQQQFFPLVYFELHPCIPHQHH